MADRKSISRRGLLKGAAAAIAAPYIVPASALGKGVWKPPSERIVMGFIGIGNMGRGHFGNFLNAEKLGKQVQIVAVCDVDTTKRKKYKEMAEERYAADRQTAAFKCVEMYNEYERLLERQDIDAVLIATPDHWHATIATAAARAGKDIYSEKPLTLTIREAQNLVKAVRRYGRVFQTGSQQRSDKNFRLACELVRSGRIGKLQKVTVSVGGPSQERYLTEEPIPEGFDWDRWLGPAPWQPYNMERSSGDYGGGWRSVRDYSGGMMTDWGAHHFDIAQWGIGMDGSANRLFEIIPHGPCPDIKVTPEEGKGLEYRYKTEQWGEVPVFHGKCGGILFTGTDGKVEVNRDYFKTWPDEIGREPLGANDVHLYDSPNHQQDWLNCIRSRQRSIADVEIGASTIITCHLGNIAYWLGRPLKWDPIKGEIIGDEEASRWLDRPRRGTWRM